MLTMVKNELLRAHQRGDGEPFTDAEIDGGGLRITTTFTQKAMDAAEEGVRRGPAGGQSSATRTCTSAWPASRSAPARCAASSPARTTSTARSTGRSRAARPARRSSRSRSRPRSRRASRSRTPSTATRPSSSTNGDEIHNEGDNDYGSAVNLLKATEDSINTAFIDLTVSMPDGPEKILEMMNAMGIPPNKGPGKHYGFPRASAGLDPYPSITLGSATISPINMANAYATIANGGRFHEPYIIEKVESQGRRGPLRPLGERQAGHRPGAGPDIAADVSYALQQVVADRHRHRGAGPRPPGRRQDRHRDQRAGPGRLGVVHRLHAAAGDLGHVRPRQGQRAARRLAAVVLRRRLPGRHLDRGHERATWRASRSRSSRRRRTSTARRPTTGHQPTLPPKPTKKPTPTETPSDTGKPTKTPTDGADADPADPGADDRGADHRRPPTRRRTPRPRRRAAASWAARRRRRAPPRRRPARPPPPAATAPRSRGPGGTGCAGDVSRPPADGHVHPTLDDPVVTALSEGVGGPVGAARGAAPVVDADPGGARC